jgi:hypothetical protein
MKVMMMSGVLWDVMLCDLVEVYQCLGGVSCLNVQGQRVGQAKQQVATLLTHEP